MNAMRMPEGGLYLPLVRARLDLPVPLPGSNAPVQMVEVELLTIVGPPSVVAAAVESLAMHLDDLLPVIADLYQESAQQTPQGG